MKVWRLACSLHSAQPMSFINYFGVIILVALISGGFYLLKNWNKLFGIDPDLTSETPGARGYGKAQAALVIAVGVKLGLLLLFHGD